MNVIYITFLQIIKLLLNPLHISRKIVNIKHHSEHVVVLVPVRVGFSLTVKLFQILFSLFIKTVQIITKLSKHRIIFIELNIKPFQLVQMSLKPFHECGISCVLIVHVRPLCLSLFLYIRHCFGLFFFLFLDIRHCFGLFFFLSLSIRYRFGLFFFLSLSIRYRFGLFFFLFLDSRCFSLFFRRCIYICHLFPFIYLCLRIYRHSFFCCCFFLFSCSFTAHMPSLAYIILLLFIILPAYFHFNAILHFSIISCIWNGKRFY